MKIILIIVFIIIGIVILALIVALVAKKEYSVEREITINKPKPDVFKYIRLLKNQDNFSVWAKIDPAMKKESKGIDGTVGFVSTWDSENKNVGKGEQEIMEINNDHRIDYELRFMKPFKSTSEAYFVTELVSDNQTKVTWGFKGKMNYPMNLMLLFLNMEKMIGKDFESGLKNLKIILEK